MAFQATFDSLSNILERHGWVSELAGILPLSALIDFIDMPPKLHILELFGRVPLWSWTITPSGSRLLLGMQAALLSRDCLQDRFGNTTALEVLDGRYGDRYFAASPETLRLILASVPYTLVPNNHENIVTPDLLAQIREAVGSHKNSNAEDLRAKVETIITDKKFIAAIELINHIKLVIDRVHPKTAATLQKEILDIVNNEAAFQLGKNILKVVDEPETTDITELKTQIQQTLLDCKSTVTEELRIEILGIVNNPDIQETFELQSQIRDVVSSPNYQPPSNNRTQALEVVHISRHDPAPVTTELARQELLRDSWDVSQCLYYATTAVGWTLLVCMLITSALLQMWISFAFYLLTPLTGLVVYALYGCRPRQLLVEKRSDYVRLLLVSEQMNSSEWIVIYGESTIVNSLLNRPLDPRGPLLSPNMTIIICFLLRVCILGQWAAALAAAATKNWNAYFICFWICFSIFTHSYLITPMSEAGAWARRRANLDIRRFCTRLSSRRALFNTVIALNPDSFSHDRTIVKNWEQFSPEGLRWLDPILAPSKDRKKWEEATRQAMKEFNDKSASLNLRTVEYCGRRNSFLSQDWRNTYHGHWKHFIPEGIYIAAEIRERGNFPKFIIT